MGRTLPADARRLYSRYMEVYAGFLSHTDHHLGRLLDFLEEQGQLDDTLIMVVSDNGASAEGGPTGTTNEAQFFNNAQEPLEDSLKVIDEIGGPKHFNHYPWGWTWAGNTPYRRWKRETYRGGACDPFIVAWPSRIRAKGEVRTQYAHIVDMVPTVLDLLEIEAPASIRGVTQAPFDGVSFAQTVDDAAAPTRHHTQYFEMLGHRAVDHDGWRAVCPWPGPSFAEASPSSNGVGVGPLFFHVYGIAYVFAVAAAIVTSRWRWRRAGGDPDLVYEVAMWAFPAGLVGGRIYFIITTPSQVPPHWWGVFAIWQGGLGNLGRCRGRRSGRAVGRAPARLARGCPAVHGRRGAVAAGRPGDRTDRQLLQPGAVRRPDQAALGPGDQPRASPARVPSVRHLSADIPL